MNAELEHSPLFLDALARLDTAWRGLPDKPEETSRSTAKALWFAAAGDPRSVVRSADAQLPTLNVDGQTRFRTLLDARLAGKPLAHLTGKQHFAGLELLSGPEALIPRRETEILARTAIEALHGANGERVAIDVCTGSGNVALAMAASEPECRVVGADLSSDAVSLAARNATALGLAGRVTFLTSDLFSALESPEFYQRAAVITCNPPYITSSRVSSMAAEISQHEPRLAFDGGALGLTIITRLLTDAPRFLRPGGTLCFEIGAGTGAFVASRVSRNPAYKGMRLVEDDRGVTRVIVATLV